MRRRRAATPATRALARASVPTWLSNGPAPDAVDREAPRRPLGERRERAVGEGDDRGPALGGRAGGVEHPALVAAQVDHDDDVAGPGGASCGRPRTLGARRRSSTPARSRPRSVGEAVRRCRRCASPARTRDLARRAVGQQVDRAVERGRGRRASRVASTLSSSRPGCGRARRGPAGSRMRSAAGRRRCAELGLDGGLQLDEAVVPELGRQPHDGGAAGPGPAGQVGHRAEGDRLGVVDARPRPPGARPGAARAMCVDDPVAAPAWNRRYSDRTPETDVPPAQEREPWPRSTPSTRPDPPR